MKRQSRIILFTLAVLLPLSSPATCRAQLMRQYRDMYFSGGIPTDKKATWDNSDLKFQLSVRTCNLLGHSPEDTELFFGYTQYSVWNFFSESAPFKDNTYSPGLYWVKHQKEGSIMFGIEHMSNGRPYFGNALASEYYDDLSRSLNYLLLEKVWIESSGQWTLRLKAGIGCGVGDYEKHLTIISQDLFLKYFGYATVIYNNDWGKFSLRAEVTPILNRSIANAEARLSYHFAPQWPAVSFTVHHGYECMCDCTPGVGASNSARVGLTFEM